MFDKHRQQLTQKADVQIWTGIVPLPAPATEWLGNEDVSMHQTAAGCVCLHLGVQVPA